MQSTDRYLYMNKKNLQASKFFSIGSFLVSIYHLLGSNDR